MYYGCIYGQWQNYSCGLSEWVDLSVSSYDHTPVMGVPGCYSHTISAQYYALIKTHMLPLRQPWTKSQWLPRLILNTLTSLWDSGRARGVASFTYPWTLCFPSFCFHEVENKTRTRHIQDSYLIFDKITIIHLRFITYILQRYTVQCHPVAWEVAWEVWLPNLARYPVSWEVWVPSLARYPVA